MAQPLKLTPEVQTQIVESIRAGACAEIAVRHAHIGVSTYYKWTKRARAAIANTNGDEPPETERLYIEFLEAVTYAKDEAEIELVHSIREAGLGRPYEKTKTTTETWIDSKGIEREKTTVTVEEGEEHDWRAGMALLERQHRERWGRPSRLEVTGPEGGPIEVDAVALREEGRVLVARILERDDFRRDAAELPAVDQPELPAGEES